MNKGKKQAAAILVPLPSQVMQPCFGLQKPLLTSSPGQWPLKPSSAPARFISPRLPSLNYTSFLNTSSTETKPTTESIHLPYNKNDEYPQHLVRRSLLRLFPFSRGPPVHMPFGKQSLAQAAGNASRSSHLSAA